MNTEKLTPSEALYGFAGWITTRDKEVVASAKHDAGVWVELISQFCEANNLEFPRDGWEHNLIHIESGECSGGSKQCLTK